MACGQTTTAVPVSFTARSGRNSDCPSPESWTTLLKAPEAVQVTASTIDPAAVNSDHAATPLPCASDFSTSPAAPLPDVVMLTGFCQVPEDERTAISIEPPRSQAAEAVLFAPIEAETLGGVEMKPLVTDQMVVWGLHVPPNERYATCTR